MLSLALLIAAFIFFLVEAFPKNLIAAGLACWTLSEIIAKGIFN